MVAESKAQDAAAAVASPACGDFAIVLGAAVWLDSV